MDFLNKRTRFTLSKTVFSCNRSKKERMLIRAGMDRLNSELKLDKIMSNFIKARIAVSTVFTKAERFLLRNNRAVVLHSEPESDPSSSTTR